MFGLWRSRRSRRRNIRGREFAKPDARCIERVVFEVLKITVHERVFGERAVSETSGRCGGRRTWARRRPERAVNGAAMAHFLRLPLKGLLHDISVSFLPPAAGVKSRVRKTPRYQREFLILLPSEAAGNGGRQDSRTASQDRAGTSP